jgi:hypothetical protein
VNLNHSIIMETTVTRPVGFDGVFRFTNATDEDYKALWNNKEYVFPAKSTCPMIIENETLENIQEIRKRWAKKLAEREYFKSKAFGKIANGDGKSVLSSYNQGELQKWIDQCLEPLPVSEVTVKKLKGDSDKNYRGSKALKSGSNLNQEFADQDIPELGAMPE